MPEVDPITLGVTSEKVFTCAGGALRCVPKFDAQRRLLIVRRTPAHPVDKEAQHVPARSLCGAARRGHLAVPAQRDTRLAVSSLGSRWIRPTRRRCRSRHIARHVRHRTDLERDAPRLERLEPGAVRIAVASLTETGCGSRVSHCWSWRCAAIEMASRACTLGGSRPTVAGPERPRQHRHVRGWLSSTAAPRVRLAVAIPVACRGARTARQLVQRPVTLEVVQGSFAPTGAAAFCVEDAFGRPQGGRVDLPAPPLGAGERVGGGIDLHLVALHVRGEVP